MWTIFTLSWNRWNWGWLKCLPRLTGNERLSLFGLASASRGVQSGAGEETMRWARGRRVDKVRVDLLPPPGRPVRAHANAAYGWGLTAATHIDPPVHRQERLGGRWHHLHWEVICWSFLLFIGVEKPSSDLSGDSYQASLDKLPKNRFSEMSIFSLLLTLMCLEGGSPLVTS